MLFNYICIAFWFLNILLWLWMIFYFSHLKPHQSTFSIKNSTKGKGMCMYNEGVLYFGNHIQDTSHQHCTQANWSDTKLYSQSHFWSQIILQYQHQKATMKILIQTQYLCSIDLIQFKFDPKSVLHSYYKSTYWNSSSQWVSWLTQNHPGSHHKHNDSHTILKNLSLTN